MSKLSQLIFCFLFALLNLTVTPLLHAENKVPTTTVEDNCNLPAPTGLSISNVTAYTADATWNAVAGATGYSVVAKNLATQQVYFSTTTPGTAITVTGLPANTEIELEVSPICANGNTGGITESIFTTDIVIEVVVGSFNGCNNNNGWQMEPNTGIIIPVNTAYEFKYSKDGFDVVNFVVFGYGAPVSDYINFYPSTQSPGYIIEFYNGSAKAYDQQSHIGEIQCGQTGQMYLFKTVKLSRYDLYYRPFPESCGGDWTPGGIGSGNPIGGGRSSDDKTVAASVESNIIAAPNPFNEQFSLLTNGYKNEPATIQLFNLSGQLVQSIATVLDDQTISVINTENLPDGMYIAKIQTSQTVNTIKVQKTSPK